MERSQDKGKDFGLLGVANCEQVNMWGKLMEGRGNFSNVCLCRFQLTVISSSWYGGGKGDTFTKRNVCSAFREGRELVLSSVSHLPSPKNNPLSKLCSLE